MRLELDCNVDYPEGEPEGKVKYRAVVRHWFRTWRTDWMSREAAEETLVALYMAKLWRPSVWMSLGVPIHSWGIYWINPYWKKR